MSLLKELLNFKDKSGKTRKITLKFQFTRHLSNFLKHNFLSETKYSLVSNYRRNKNTCDSM